MYGHGCLTQEAHESVGPRDEFIFMRAPAIAILLASQASRRPSPRSDLGEMDHPCRLDDPSRLTRWPQKLAAGYCVKSLTASPVAPRGVVRLCPVSPIMRRGEAGFRYSTGLASRTLRRHRTFTNHLLTILASDSQSQETSTWVRIEFQEFRTRQCRDKQAPGILTLCGPSFSRLSRCQTRGRSYWDPKRWCRPVPPERCIKPPVRVLVSSALTSESRRDLLGREVSSPTGIPSALDMCRV